MTVNTLIIYGTLKWDIEKEGIELRAGYILVAEGGYLQVGTRMNPMQRRATIYITEGNESHPWLGTRFLGSTGAARIDIHGRVLQRTWTLLSKTSQELSAFPEARPD
mmetsp:Transcript_33320/g.59828  ORF Transcript_33320/g.59828 Transcript_33320/m.59828 type:complete len:107 (-) Transcript_33320:2347-2667(-)